MPRSTRFPAARRQQGATLLVGLVMLVVLTLLVVSGIRASSANLKIVGNVQARDEAAAQAQLAVEDMLNNVSNFYNPASRTLSVDADGDGSAEYTVLVSAPVCLKLITVDGYSVEFADSAPKDSYWDVAVQVTDARTGATATAHQGVKVRLDSTANCPG